MLGLAIFAALFYLTVRRGATDPVCGMKVDRARRFARRRAGRTYFFCSEECRAEFKADPERVHAKGAPAGRRARRRARPLMEAADALMQEHHAH